MKAINNNKSLFAGIGLTLLITSLTACDWGADSDMVANNTGVGPGYDAGYEFGIKLALLRQQQPDIELDEAFKGLLDALLDTSQIISRTEMCARLQPAELEPAEVEFKPADNTQPPTEAHSYSFVKLTTDDYAALNAGSASVVTLPSGVRYEVLNEGSGEQPQAGDAIQISYQAFLDNGTVIDSTVNSGPSHISLDDVLAPGLKEVLLLMNAGAKWLVVLPPSTDQDRPVSRMFHGRERRMIRRRDLIYDIELISIDSAQTDKASD